MTEAERRFYRPIIRLSPKTGRIFFVEGFDEHIDRMRKEAKKESTTPKEPHRIISRIQQIDSIRSLVLGADERRIIRGKLIRDSKGRVLLRPNVTIYDVEKAILRYRRLTRRS